MFFIFSELDGLINFPLILQVFKILLPKFPRSDDLDNLILINKGHLLFESLDLWKVVNFEIRPQFLEDCIDGCILARMDEVIGDCSSIGQRHFGDVFKQEEVFLHRLGVLATHSQLL